LYLLLLKLNSRGSVTRSAEENPLPCSCMGLLFYTDCSAVTLLVASLMTIS
jgi:hypothetical protein